jgi:hypothetical protein
MTSRLRIVALGLFAGLTLAASGCGGVAKTGGTSSSAASLVRADSLVFFTVDTDTSSSQWKQLDTLLQKFPGSDQALAKIQQSLTGQGVSYQDDVKPALGPQVDFVVGSGDASPSKVTGIGLTKPDDPDKLKALVDKMNAQPGSGHPSVMRKLSDGWYALGDSQSAIDRVLKGTGDSLADQSTYKDALSKLPSDTLATAYVNGQQLGATIHQSMQSSHAGALSGSTAGLDKLDFVAASLNAEDDGVRLHGAVQGQGASTIGGSGDYSSKLLSETPSDAFAFLSFRGGNSLGAGLGQLSAPLQLALGVSLQDVLALFQNENALWVRPGALIPEFTAILQPDDTASGLATLDKLVRKLAGSSGATVTGGAEKTISFGKRFQLHYGAVGSKIVLTSAPGGIKTAGSTSGSLADSADFKEAKSAAGMASSNGGFLYLDLKNALPLIEGFAALSGTNLGSSTVDNLRPLRSLLTWSGGSGNSRTFDAFLEIK